MTVWTRFGSEVGGRGWDWEEGAGPWLSQATPTPQPDNSSEGNLDLPHRGLADSSADLSCDSRVNSDYETDGEGYTDGEGGPHTDVDEGPPAPALARSSEPVLADEPQSPGDHGRAPGPRGAQVSRAQAAAEGGGAAWQGSWVGLGHTGEPVCHQDVNEQKLL